MPHIVDADEAAARIAEGPENDRFEIHFPKALSRRLTLLRCLPYKPVFPDRPAPDSQARAAVIFDRRYEKHVLCGQSVPFPGRCCFLVTPCMVNGSRDFVMFALNFTIC